MAKAEKVEKVEGTEDLGTKVESKDVLPETLSTELKGESKGPEFKVANAKSGVLEKSGTLKVIRN